MEVGAMAGLTWTLLRLIVLLCPACGSIVYDLGHELSVTLPYTHGAPRLFGGGFAYTYWPTGIASCSWPTIVVLVPGCNTF